jgi:hypothetical protein
MKGVALILTLLAAGSPVMATVTIALVDNGDLTADLVMVSEGDDLDALGNSRIAGVALEVSVDRGVIVAVPPRSVEFPNGYKVTGESFVGDKGYGIFPSSITFTGSMPGPHEIADTGTPVVGDLPSDMIVLEFGALYDQGVPMAAPGASTVLCTMIFSESCNAHLAVNATWGGIVLIGGGAPSAVDLIDGSVGPRLCVERLSEAEQVEYWKYINASCGWYTHEQMACWCSPYQCFGDVKNNTETFFGYRVYISDLNHIVNNWKKRICDPGLDPCADVDHFGETFFQYRVYIKDLNLVIQHWKKKDSEMPAHCPGWMHGQ